MAEFARTPDRSRELRVREHDGEADDVSLKVLLSRLSRDATQLAHDELELAKLELRDVAETLSDEVREAGRTAVKDLTKIGMALSLAFMAGLALTAGAVLAIGELLGDAFWAGGLIVGILLLAAAALALKSASADARDSDALRLRETKRTLREDREVLSEEARETKDFVKRGAREFRDHASPGRTSTHQPH